jgi:hypothetical protein
VAELSQARVCGRLLAAVGSSNPAGVWMFVLCVVSINERQNGEQRRQRHKFRRSTEYKRIQKKNPTGGMGVCVMCCKRTQKGKMLEIQDEEKAPMKYKQSTR